MSREILKDTVKVAEKNLADAVAALEAYDRDPENRVYESLAHAERILEDELYERARTACEGSYCVGEEEYRQEFFVLGKKYVAIATFEYNRYDKTYYYIDGSGFWIEEVKDVE